MRVTSCGLVLCMVLLLTSHAQAGEKRQIRLTKISKQLDKLTSLVESMQTDKERCCSHVSDMDTDIQNLTKKIDHLDSACIAADVNIAGDGKHCDSQIRMELPAEFHKCLEDVEKRRMSSLNANIWCLRLVLWRFQQGINEHDESLELLQYEEEGTEENRVKRSGRFIRRRIAPRPITHPGTGFRIRREYRTLSLDERQRFHNAMNVLYEDGTLECFALIHQAAIKKKGAHGGPAFLPWHRPFLAFIEEALRQVDPTVSLPYWDSSIDDNLQAGPGLSNIWDEEHFGKGTGPVDEGPFTNWMTPKNPLSRKIARGVGSLMRQQKIDNLKQYCRLQEYGKRLEWAHNNVHRWVGGTMARSLAACDPIFYMHHAFIDYQWEEFRKRQLSDCVGVDPQYDYPPTDDVHHQADTPMDGMRFLLNRDGIENFWTQNWYNYEERPTCDNNCQNSPDMFCDFSRNVCVAEMRYIMRAASPPPEAMEEERKAEANYEAGEEAPTCDPKNIYESSCSRAPVIRSQEDFIKAMVLDEADKPYAIAEMYEELKSEEDYSSTYPSDSESVFFQGAPDEKNDDRTMETTELDMLIMVVKGVTTEARRYAKQLGMVRPSK